MTQQAQAIVLLSGGMDSLVCAAQAVADHKTVGFLHMDYGQKTSAKERECFTKIANHYQIPQSLRKVVDVSFLKQIGGSSLTDDNIKVKEYDGDESSIPSSYVPFRNSIILSLAVSWAEVVGANQVYIGANHEDSPGYPDCRPSYYEAYNKVVELGTKDGNIRIITPVISLKKKDIVLTGQKLNVPFALSWSCYASTGPACGICDSCVLRKRGFQEANLQDPIPYA